MEALKVSPLLIKEGLELLNQEFDNKKNYYFLGKKNAEVIDVSKFKEELIKINPQLEKESLKDDDFYKIARNIILSKIKKNIAPLR